MFKKIAKLIKLSLFELSLSNIYWMIRLKNFNFPILIFRSLHLRMGKNSRIIHRAGRLHLGCRWGISRYKESDLTIYENGTLEIRGDMKIYTGCSVDICSGATLSLGSGGISNGARIVVFDKIIIGHNVGISENVTFRDSDNHCIIGSTKPVTSPIIIGDNVWIGINATILKGVTVGEGAVIAANSLVNKDVPPHVLVGGVPAKILKENILWNTPSMIKVWDQEPRKNHKSVDADDRS